MTKAPRAGQVKTRLVPPLTNEEAAQLNKCFLQDTGAAISVCCSGLMAPNPGRPIVCGVAVYTPVGSESDYTDILSADFSLLPQRGKEFGERLYFAAEDLFNCGFKTICLIDSDSPTVPADNFAQAIELLSLPGDRIVGPLRRWWLLFDRIKTIAPRGLRANRLEHRAGFRANKPAREPNRYQGS